MTDFVSVFSGAGGLDIGLQRAGWDCLYATDFDKNAIETLKLNAAAGRHHSGCAIRQADIRDLTGDEMLSEIGKRRGDIALLAGGPPCQSWSSAGHQLGFNDPRGRLFEDYLRVAKELDVVERHQVASMAISKPRTYCRRDRARSYRSDATACVPDSSNCKTHIQLKCAGRSSCCPAHIQKLETFTQSAGGS